MRPDKKQKVVLWSALAVVAVMALCPPWTMFYRGAGPDGTLRFSATDCISGD